MNAALLRATVALSLAFATNVSAAAATSVEGRWSGVVDLLDRNLTLVIRIQPTPAGVSAILSIPESKLIQFPAPKASFAEGRLTLEVPPKWGLSMFRDIGLPSEEQVIRYEGDARGDEIVGRLQVAYASFPLTLRRLRPEALPYNREEVTFRNGEVTLAGTLYLPKDSGRHPALLFSHGSGETTRDTNAYEADQLARAGIAALIYDKRGEGSSTGANWKVATFDELAGDLEAGLHFLRGRADIDPLRIGLFGLSQGTWLIGMVAARSADVGFLVFVSGSGILAAREQSLPAQSQQARCLTGAPFLSAANRAGLVEGGRPPDAGHGRRRSHLDTGLVRARGARKLRRLRPKPIRSLADRDAQSSVVLGTAWRVRSHRRRCARRSPAP